MEGKVYLWLTVQDRENTAVAMAGELGSRLTAEESSSQSAHILNHKQQVQWVNREVASLLKTSKLAPNDVLLDVRLHFLNLPTQSHQPRNKCPKVLDRRGFSS